MKQSLRLTLLFLLALWPRAYDLGRFVTADEAKWVYRSARFLAAFLHGDMAATSVNLTPAVTTTWLGSIGLTVYYYLHQATIGQPLSDWLMALPEFRTSLELLVATRWPMVIFTSFGVVVIYLLASRLFNPTVALLGAIFLALDPHSVALSRVIGHDAPTATFSAISLLLLILSPTSKNQKIILIFSGIAAGLAMLSKITALFLIPFTVLVLIVNHLKIQTSQVLKTCKVFVLWLIAAYLTFIIVWPSAWTEPVGRPYAVIQNGFLSATDQEEADAEGFWLVPDLSYAYYLVNGAYKFSPMVTIGLGLYLLKIYKRRTNFSLSRPHGQTKVYPAATMLAFAVLFTLFMTLGDKRSSRYILPIFPPLALIAAVGWQWAINLTLRRSEMVLAVSPWLKPLHALSYSLLTLTTMITLFPYAPYYFTYFNPLLGGAYTAPAWVKIGWGEGLDQVGRFFQRELPASRVGTAYASTIAPYFKGKLSGVTAQNLDYIVLYRKQVQSGSPSPAFIRYFQHFPPIFKVDLNGLHYADVYTGPTLIPVKTVPGVIAFRSLKNSSNSNNLLEIDVLWSPASANLPTSAMMTLHATEKIIATSKASPTLWSAELLVSHHQFSLPADLVSGKYILQINGQFMGELEF